MSLGKENMFGTRLKLARKMAGLSLQELANSLNGKVTKQALSKYENGLMNPSSEILISISNVLGLKPDYFLKKKSINFGKIQFRKKVRFSKKQEHSIIEKIRDYVERHLEIEQILNIESIFTNPLKNMVVSNKQDAENAAEILRQEWELGKEPISNLVEMLELRGVKVFLFEGDDEIDGLAVFTSNGIPIVAVNIKNRSIERIRFTIIHELAHLLIKFAHEIITEPKKMEILCHYFSSNILVPTEILLKLIGPKRTYIRIKELISIKEYYGISIRAIVYRLKDIQVISDTYYKRWVIFMSKTYGAKKEPGNYIGKEKAKLFDQLINRALAEELISISKAATLWNVNIDEIRKGYDGGE